MIDWRKAYKSRDWDSVDNWWRTSDDRAELLGLLGQLRRDVPKRTLENGVETVEESISSEKAGEGWKGAAEILELGELEAKVAGVPADDAAIWSEQSEGLSAELRNLLAMPEVTEGDAELSRRAHAGRALEALEQIAETIRFRIGMYDQDEREPLCEFAAAIAINALRAGYFARAAESKKMEVDAVRGQKTKSSAKTGGETRARQTKPTKDAVIQKMRVLIEAGHTVSGAADAAHRVGIGSSQDANRKLWYQNSQEK
jgi:hypothetical protein